MVEFNRGGSLRIVSPVEETDDPVELVELSDEIVHLITDKRQSHRVIRRKMLKVMDRIT